jgi:sugar/nucleoside kinase (ribokinase family)
LYGKKTCGTMKNYRYVFFALLTAIFLPTLAAEPRLIPKTAQLEAVEKERVEYDVLGVGTAMTDLIIQVSDEFLQKHGGQKGTSLVVPSEKIDEILRDAQFAPIVKPGGSGPNTLKSIGRLGLRTAYHLRDSTDEFGKNYVKNLTENNVAVIKVDDNLLPSGRLVCLITPDKNRSFCSSPGAGDAFSPADLQPKCFKDAKLVHLDGYSLRNESLVEETMKLAKEHGALISFDPGCYQLCREYRELILRLMDEYVDIMFANEDEAKELFNLPSEQACAAMTQLVPVSVVLLGRKGCLVGTKEKMFALPVRDVPVVDTTGAGDLFASGFLYGFLQGYSMERCAYIGRGGDSKRVLARYLVASC